MNEQDYTDANRNQACGVSAKRIFDIVGSSVGLLLLSPLLLITYILIKIDDGGPVFYSQERIGRGGKPFIIYKFRSMLTDAEKDGVPRLSGEDDIRQTRVGLIMRKYHIDELPQLWNVLKGDMSLVGYRPERRFFIEKIMERDSRYKELYAIRPGLFSKATLYNGYTNTLDKMLVRLEMDLEYLKKHNIFRDTKIIFANIFYMVSGRRI